MHRLRLTFLTLTTIAILLLTASAAVSAEESELTCTVVDGIYTCETTVTAPAPTEEEELEAWCDTQCFVSNPWPGHSCDACWVLWF